MNIHPVSITRKRRKGRERARRYLEKHRDALKELRKADNLRCADLTLLESKVTKQENGCWLWTGLVYDSWERVVPCVRIGKGRMLADRAMWLATRGKKVPKGAWLARTCERVECIAPDHLYEMNKTTLTARSRLKELEKNSPETYKEVMESLI